MCYHNLYNSWAWLGGHTNRNKNFIESNKILFYIFFVKIDL